jgi:hypothetical protein
VFVANNLMTRGEIVDVKTAWGLTLAERVTRPAAHPGDQAREVAGLRRGQDPAPGSAGPHNLGACSTGT